MFELGFSELLLTAVVALLVLGPERLPRAARMGGLMVRRARASWFSVKAQFERELADEELKRSLRDTGAALDSLRKELQAPVVEPARPTEPNPQAIVTAAAPPASAGTADGARGLPPDADSMDSSAGAPVERR